MIRVLMVCAEYPPVIGGIADYTQRLASALVEQGTEVTVLTSVADAGESVTIEDGVRVLRIMRGWGFRDLPRLLATVREAGEGALVHIQYPGVAFRRNPMINLLPALLRARAGGPHVAVTVHDARVMRRRWRARLAPMLAAARAVVHVDAPDGPYLARWSWLNRPIRVCIPIGPSIPPVAVGDRQGWREALGLAGVQPVVAFFGLLYPHKGLPELVEAIGSLRCAGRPVRLLVIGDFDRPTSYERNVCELLREGIGDGWVVWLRGAGADEVSRALHAADVAALPFHSGAASNRSSLLCALAHALPTVTTRGPATPEDFSSRYPVSLVPVRSPAALARAIAAELDRNRSADESFRAQCAAIIPSLHEVAARHVAVYAALAGRRGVAG